MTLAGINYHRVAHCIPPISYGADERVLLRGFGIRAGLALRAVVQGRTLGHIGQFAWPDERQRLLSFTGVADDNHCLGTRGHDWLWPLERQATEGFAHFLCAGSPLVRRGRTLAFLKALDPPADRAWPEQISGAMVVAEQRIQRGAAKNGRIDLMIVAQGSEGPVGAVIEAKFEHVLSANPLPAYVAEAGSHGLNSSNCSFLVVGSRNDASIRRRLKRNQRWRFQSWRRLLMAHERLLAPEFDDHDYRRFRRTIAARAQ